MKKQIFTYLALITIAFNANSQAPRGLYVTAGVNQTMLNSSDLEAESGTGYFLGANFNMGYHETYNFQAEILANQNNINLKSVDADFSNPQTKKFSNGNYELGFYFNYYILKPEEEEFFFGPQVGVYTTFGNSLTPADGGGSSGSTNYLPHMISEIDLTNVSTFNYGAGLGLTGGYNNFRFDLRYRLGLNNSLEDIKTGYDESTGQYTGPALNGKFNNISFGVSYNISSLFNN